jgi:hypothetical protein
MNQGLTRFRTSEQQGRETGFVCAERSRFGDPARMFSAIHSSSTGSPKENLALN